MSTPSIGGIGSQLNAVSAGLGLGGSRGVTDSRTIHFGANESKEDRMARIEEITKGNPNVKLTPEAFQKLMQGGDVDVTLNLDAPERRNLFIGAFATLAQMGGAAGGAAYNKDLGNAIVGRNAGDAEFVLKHGDNYKLNLFGGATAQTGHIEVGDPVFDPTLSNDDIMMSKIKENLAAQAVGGVRAVNIPQEENTPMDLAIQARFLEKYGYKQQELSGVGKSTQDGMSGNNIARSILNGEYGAESVDQGGVKGKGREVIASIHVYGKNGENYLSGDDLKGNGKTVEQNEAILTARRQAVKDYLQLGLSSGVITQKDLNDIKSNPKNKNLTEDQLLIEKFKVLEGKLKVGYGDKSGTVKDGFLGDHHIMAMQRAISDKLQYNQGAAFAINSAANGNITGTGLNTDQKKAALEFAGIKLDSIPLTDKNGKKLTDKQIKALTETQINAQFTDFATGIKNKDPIAVGQAIGALDGVTRAQKDLLFGKGGDNNNIKGGLLGTAHGSFALHNTILAQNINSTGLVDTSKITDKKMKTNASSMASTEVVAGLNPTQKSGEALTQTNRGSSFNDQIENLKSKLTTPRLDSKSTETSDKVTLTIGGKSADLSDLVKAINGDENGKKSITSMSQTDRDSLISVLKNAQKASESTPKSETEAKTEGKPDFEAAIKAVEGLAIASPDTIQRQNQDTIAKNIGNVNTFLDGKGNTTETQLAKASTAIGEISEQMKKAGLDPEKDPAFVALKAKRDAIVPQTNADAVGTARSAQAKPSAAARLSKS